MKKTSFIAFTLTAIMLFCFGLISTSTQASIWPDVDIAPNPLVFSDTIVGETSETQIFTVSNSSRYLPVYVFATKLSESSIFSIESDECAGHFIETQSSCEISLKFTPASSTHYAATLSLIDTSSSIIDYSIIDGTGIAPAATVVPSSINFGDQSQGRSSGAHAVYLTNSGSSTLNIASIATGNEFSSTDDCGSSLQSGESCTIEVVFTPTELGEVSGSLTITDDATGGPQTVSLSGTGIEPGSPDVSLSSHYVNFGGQQINTTSDPAYITLTNSGTVELTISEISASDNFSVTDDCGDTLSSGSECTLSITFSPSSSTSYSGAVTIIDDTTDSPQSITLEGIGLSPGEPVVSLSISSMDFGEQTVETTSDAQVLTVTNMGSSDLEISSVTLSGNGSHSYNNADNCHGKTIAGGQSCSAAVSFAPTSNGAHSASLYIEDNSGNGSQAVSLTGTGIGGTSSGGGCSLLLK